MEQSWTGGGRKQQRSKQQRTVSALTATLRYCTMCALRFRRFANRFRGRVAGPLGLCVLISLTSSPSPHLPSATSLSKMQTGVRRCGHSMSAISGAALVVTGGLDMSGACLCVLL